MIKNVFYSIKSIGIEDASNPFEQSKIRLTNTGMLFWMTLFVFYWILTFANVIDIPSIMPFFMLIASILVWTLNHLGYYKLSAHIFILLPTLLIFTAPLVNPIGANAIVLFISSILLIFILFENRRIIILYISLFTICGLLMPVLLYSDLLRPQNFIDILPVNAILVVIILIFQYSFLNFLKHKEDALSSHLKLNENRFKAIFESNPLGILISNAKDQSQKEANKELVKMFGYTKATLESKKISEITYNEDKNTHLSTFKKLTQYKTDNMNITKRYVRADGSIFYANTSAAFVHNSKGEQTHYFAMIEDIDKSVRNYFKIEALFQELKTINTSLENRVEERSNTLQKANEELIRSNQDLQQFTYIASHDLQEPLRMIGNFVQLLKRRYSDKIDEEGQQYIDFAVEGVQRMSDLIRGLLEFSKVGRKEIQLRKKNLNHIIEAKIYDLNPFIESKNAIVNVSNFPNELNCEPSQVGMVFSHLIENAIKFNQSETPTVDVTCQDTKTHYQFSVADNGIGIAPEYYDQAFEIFKRLHTRDEYEGNGIGLALCRKIIHRHHGKIWIESQEGKGTTVHFTMSKKLG